MERIIETKIPYEAVKGVIEEMHENASKSFLVNHVLAKVSQTKAPSFTPMDATEAAMKFSKELESSTAECTVSPAPTHSESYMAIANRVLAKVIDVSPYRVDPNKDYGKAECLLTINGVGCGHRGDIIAVTGRAKQGKSMAVAAEVAMIISTEYTIAGKAQSKPGKVIYFDTEQHPRNGQKQIERIASMLGLPPKQEPDGLIYYSLRLFKAEDREHIIIQQILAEKPDAIVIDGIRDLVISINSEEEATRLTQTLMVLAEECNIAIFCVLHKNKGKGDDTMRGHLGAELENKAAEVWDVSCENGIFTVKLAECRNEPVPDWHFCLDKNGTPAALGEEEQKQLQEKKEKKGRKKPQGPSAQEVEEFLKAEVTKPMSQSTEITRLLMKQFSQKNSAARNIVQRAIDDGKLVACDGKHIYFEYAQNRTSC